MNDYTIDTLFELLDKFTVEVPILQRDYAQGRFDSHTKMVRDNLLADIKAALRPEAQPLDLNFVYGKVEGGKFIPVDGQQRLTTLFLLHLYAFRNDDSKTGLLHKFTYETRPSSRDFLRQLTENRKAVFSADTEPSKIIRDSAWFVAGWKYDPTIQSALVMIDAIKVVFRGFDDLDRCLENQTPKPVVFRFFKTEDLGHEDSLYIKLNARGKPLTLFENFKARLIGRLRQLRLPFTADEFERLFDLEWTEMFWAKNRQNFDQAYLAFFGVLLMNKGLLPRDDDNWSNTYDYENIGEEIYETSYHSLNFLCNNHERQQIHDLVFAALTERRTYKDRVLLHAVTAYLHPAKGVDTGSLGNWIRIIKNLTLNSQINDLNSYRRSIEGINGFAKNWDNLLEYFGDADNQVASRGFSLEQVEEERIKARIILQDEAFAEALYEAEKHPYFNGQIRSALHYCKDENGNHRLESFKQYWGKISSLFDERRPIHGEHLLRRALLTFDDYTLPVGPYKTFCVNDPEEAEDTPSMKSLFSRHGNLVKKIFGQLGVE